jgi:hypothetical protein
MSDKYPLEPLPPEGERRVPEAAAAIVVPIYEEALTRKITKKKNRRIEFWLAARERLMEEVDYLAPRAVEVKRLAPGSPEDDAYSWRIITLGHAILIMGLVVGDQESDAPYMELADAVWDNSEVAVRIETEGPEDFDRVFQMARQMAHGLT